ncbi:MAG: hypothetical protein QM607_10995 [Microbacterium sp.]
MYYAPAPTPQRPAGRPALGVWSLVVAIAGTVISSALGLFGGLTVGDTRQLGYEPTDAEVSQLISDLFGATAWILLAVLVCVVLSIWALIQGIVATVMNRGRAAGIAAIIIASLGWILLVLAVTFGLLFGLGTLLGGAA